MRDLSNDQGVLSARISSNCESLNAAADVRACFSVISQVARDYRKCHKFYGGSYPMALDYNIIRLLSPTIYWRFRVCGSKYGR